MKKMIALIIALMLALSLVACNQEITDPTTLPTTEPTAAPTTEPTTEIPTTEPTTELTEPVDLLYFHDDFEEVTVYPFTDEEIRQAYDVLIAALSDYREKEEVLNFEVHWIAMDPVKADHQVCSSMELDPIEGWTEEDYYPRWMYFVVNYTVSYDHTLSPNMDYEQVCGSVRLSRESVDTVWQVDPAYCSTHTMNIVSDMVLPRETAESLALTEEPVLGAYYVEQEGGYILYTRNETGDGVTCHRVSANSVPTIESNVQLKTIEDRFRELLSSENGFWYWRAMGCIFEKPQDIDMSLLCYLGMENSQHSSTFTDAEIAFLKTQDLGVPGDDSAWSNAHKLPRQELNSVLQDHFGITLDDVTIPRGWVYFYETDAYYDVRYDAYGVVRQTVTDVQTDENGLIHIYWTAEFITDSRYEEHALLIRPQMVMVLQEKDDGSYLVMSNTVYAPKPGPLSDDELAEFTELLTWKNDEETMWYNYALKSEYTTPEDVNLFELFYSAPMETLTDDDRKYLLQEGQDPDADPMIHKYSLNFMDEILEKYFGIKYADCNKVGLNKMTLYIFKTNSYYHRHGDFVCAYITVNSGERMEDGTIQIHYDNNLIDPEGPVSFTVTLMPAGSRYYIISNICDSQ